MKDIDIKAPIAACEEIKLTLDDFTSMLVNTPGDWGHLHERTLEEIVKAVQRQCSLAIGVAQRALEESS